MLSKRKTTRGFYNACLLFPDSPKLNPVTLHMVSRFSEYALSINRTAKANEASVSAYGFLSAMGKKCGKPVAISAMIAIACAIVTTSEANAANTAPAATAAAAKPKPGEVASVLRKALSAAKPGTTIEVPDGTYADLGTLKITAKGTAQKPITLRAATPGGVTFTGNAQIVVESDYVVISGFRFTDGKPATGSGVFAIKGNHNRVTDCAIIDYNVGIPENTKDSTFWVGLRGQYNRVDHCFFKGKTSQGVLLFVQRPTAEPDYAQIDHNVFRDNPLGSGNGYETIRIGTSEQSQSDSISSVTENYFENCDGEIEIVSVKSGKNTIRDNTFINCRGSLTLRHGSNNTATGNIFLITDVNGAKKIECCGIRINDLGHIVENNYVSGIRTKANAHRGGIVLMASEGDGKLKVFEHWRVQDITVRHNTVVDCQQSFVYGGGNYGTPPLSATLENNLVANPVGDIVRAITPLLKPTYTANLYHGGPLGIAAATGIDTATDPQLTAKTINGYTLYFPATAEVGAKAAALKPLRETDVGTSYKN